MKNQTLGVLVASAVGVVLAAVWYFRKPKPVVVEPPPKEIHLKMVTIPNLLWEKETSCLPSYGGVLVVGDYPPMEHNAKIQADAEDRDIKRNLEVITSGASITVILPNNVGKYLEDTRSNILDQMLSNPRARVWMRVSPSFFVVNRMAITSNPTVTLIVTKSLNVEEGLLIWGVVSSWLIAQQDGDVGMAQDVYNEMIRCVGIMDPRPLAAVFSQSLSYMYAMDGFLVQESEEVLEA